MAFYILIRKMAKNEEMAKDKKFDFFNRAAVTIIRKWKIEE